MKKNLFAVVLLAGAVSMVTAQTSGKVGVNTSTPQATLDVKPSAANAAATATTNEGLLIPRLTKARVANIAAANLVEGTQVYVTDDVATADSATFTGTGKGFYYYNGTKWVKQTDANAAAGVTAQNGLSMNGSAVELGGTLLKNTNIAQAGFNLTTTGAGNVGIGTSAPAAKLDVDGRVRIDSSNPIVLGVGIAEYETPWARGLVFNNMAQNQYYGGFMAYGAGTNNEAGVQKYIIGKYGAADELVQVFPISSISANKLTKLNTRLQITDLPAGADTDAILVTDPAGNIRKLGSLSGAVAANGEWVYTAGTNTIDLRRSGTGTFTNKVFYDNANGRYVNDNIGETIEHYNGTALEQTVNSKYALENITVKASLSPEQITAPNQFSTKESSAKTVSINTLLVDSADQASSARSNNRYGSINTVSQDSNNNNSYNLLQGSANNVEVRSASGTNTLLVGSAGTVAVRTGASNVTGYSYGVRGESYWNSAGTINDVSGGHFILSGGSNAGTISGGSASTSRIALSNFAGKAGTLYGLRTIGAISGSGTVDNLIGVGYNSFNVTAANVTNHYGIKLDDITAGTNKWAIYTGTGKTSLGDVLQLRTINDAANASTSATDKILVADAEGNVKTQSAASVGSLTEPWRVTGTTEPATLNTQDIYQMGDVTVGSTQDDPTLEPNTVYPGATSIGNSFKSYNSVAVPEAGVDGKTYGKLAGSALSLISRSTDNGASVGSQAEIQLQAASYTDDIATVRANGASIRKYGTSTGISANLKDHLFVNNRLNGGATIAFTDANELDFRIGGYFSEPSTSKMKILPNGNVGIGTTAPWQKLNVYGKGNVQARVSSTDNNAEVVIASEGQNSGNITFFRTPSVFSIGVAQHTQTINLKPRDVNGADVGIGTITPTEKLHVIGNVKADQFIASTSTFPDYVFQNYYTGTASNLNPNYKFTSLADTEKFIKTNGHLPGFEKAEAVVAKGEFSVSETAIKSLEKIEELYLHVIELEKRVKSLEKENAELKAVK